MTKQLNILLLGDTCTDEYYYGSCDRLNPEAPVPVLNITHVEKKAGMAANVYNNLLAFGCNVRFIEGNQRSIKARYIDQRSKQHIVRVDRDAVSDVIDIAALDLSLYHAIVVSDYNKGAISYELVERLRSRFDGPIFVDTKKAELHRFNRCYVKINEKEYNSRTSDGTNVIVTLGERGAQYNEMLHLGFQTEVIDVCGAGDTFLAALVVKSLHLNDVQAAIPYANHCSAIAVSHNGVYTLTTDDIDSLDERKN